MQNNKDHAGHRKRLRAKFINSGLDGLLDYEQVELLLTYAVPVKDVKQTGKALIKKFKSISALLDAGSDELKEIKGLGESSVVLIKLIRSLLTKYSEEEMLSVDVLSSPEKVYEFAKLRIGAHKNESLMTIFLNTKNIVISYEIISEGSIDSVAVYPRKIIELALNNNAAGIIIVHNHPSGDTSPSTSDNELTKELKKITESMDIKLLDHIIVSKNSNYSFSKEGKLE